MLRLDDDKFSLVYPYLCSSSAIGYNMSIFAQWHATHSIVRYFWFKPGGQSASRLDE
jgi:hypothetical protein